jgi:hypothetical protein
MIDWRGRVGPAQQKTGRKQFMHLHTTKLTVLAVTAIFGIAGSQPTRAEISSLSVTSAKDIGPFRGKPYREVEAQLSGPPPVELIPSR